MEENYKTQKIFKDLMKNSQVKSSLGFGQRKGREAVLDVMTKQKIITDPRKLTNREREDFLKAVKNRKELGISAKRAVMGIFDEKKELNLKPKISAKEKSAARQKTYDEIMGKRRSVTAESLAIASRNQDFRVSNKNMHAAEGLMRGQLEKPGVRPKSPLIGDQKRGEDINERLKRIQE